MKKIPRKNYIIVGIISVLTVVLVGYFAFWYKETKEYVENNSIMTGYLSEIGEDQLIDNLSNYILDNPNAVLYVSNGNDLSLKDFEKEFKMYINDNNIKQTFVYIDLNKVKNKKIVDEFKDNFLSTKLNFYDIELDRQPNLFVFEDGKIQSALYYTRHLINMDDVKLFLRNEGVVEND